MRSPRIPPCCRANHLSSYFVLFTTLLFLFAASVSCTKNRRNDTLRATFVAVTAAKVGFVAWDRDYKQAIVDKATTREQAETELAHYYERRKPVLDGFELAIQSIADAATLSDDPSLKTALAVAADLLAAVQRLRGGGA